MYGLFSIISGFYANIRYLIPGRRRRIGYIGWIGHGNLGDEAIFYACQKLLRNFIFLRYKYTKKMQFFQPLKRKGFYDAILLGGGTLINSPGSYETFSRVEKYQPQLPKFVLGAGVKDPFFWNRVQGWNNLLDEWVEILRKCGYVSVRGPLSQKILSKCDFHAPITGDTALYWANDQIVRRRYRKHLGLNIGTAGGMMWRPEDELLAFIVELVRNLVGLGWQVTFFPVWKADVQYVLQAVKMIGHSNVSVFPYFNCLRKSISFLETCDVFIGQKLHSVVLAHCAHTPAIMLEYRPKCLDYMLSMGMEKFNIRLDSLNVDHIISLIDLLYCNIEKYQVELLSKTAFFKKQLTSASGEIARRIDPTTVASQ